MNLSKFITQLIFVVAFFSILLVFLVSIFFQFNNLENDLNQYKFEFTEQKKREVRNEVLMIYGLLQYREELLIKNLEQKLQEKVNQAYDLAMDIYKSNKNIKTEDEIKYLLEQNKEEILSWISSLKYENSSYIFVNSLDGKSLIFEGKRVEPKPHPFPELFNQQLETAKNPNGDFFEYKFKKPNSNEEFDKISFVKKYEKYNWIIGCGVYLDEINDELKKKEEIFYQNIRNQITSMIIVFLLILIGIYFISKKIGDFINININNLVKAFSKASLDNKKIDTEKLTYTEFVILANNLNETLENKNNLEKELQNLSITDELTQLYNRRFFNSKIEEEINRAKRENKHLCLMVLDIDFFKQYNDTYGHQKGDFVLQEISKVLKNRTNRASDFAFRIGGEEFAILVNLEKNKISEFAEAIKNDIENLKIEHSGNKVSKYVTTSIGVNFKQADELKNIDELFKVADDNLYEAKKNGRNCVVIQ